MVSAIRRTFPPQPSRPEAPPYHHYATALLSRRWVLSYALSAIIAYIEAVLISSKRHIFWTLFSAAPTKTFVICCAILPVFLLKQVWMYQAGSLRAPSIVQKVVKCLGSITTYYTIGAYVFSSVVITVLYLVNSNDKDQLGIVIELKSHERPRLNERFLYLCFLSVVMGFVQGIYHIYSDRERIEFPSLTLRSEATGPDAPNMAPKDQLIRVLKDTVAKAGVQSTAACLSGPLLYVLIRKAMWRYTHRITRLFYRINKSSQPYQFPVGFKFFFRSLWLAFLVFFMWESVHTIFRYYLTLEPLREGKTLSEKSPDPNGTLVNGLKTKSRPFTKLAAFWELVHIAYNVPSRRKSILTDIDRPRRIWDEIVDECLRVLMEVNNAIKKADQLTPAPPQQPSPVPSTISQLQPEHPLPQIPLKEEPNAFKQAHPDSRTQTLKFLQASPEKHQTFAPFTPLKKSIIETIHGITPNFRPQVQYAKQKVANSVLQSRVGEPFKQIISRRTEAMIPNVYLPVDAIAALTRFSCASLAEDQLGTAYHNVNRILVSFFESIDLLEDYVARPPIHWTDTEAESTKRSLKEPEILLRTLRAGAREIATVFKPFYSDIGLSPKAEKRCIELLAEE